jgi:hypothetical protein
MMTALNEQLDDWYRALPPPLRFEKTLNCDKFPDDGRPLAPVIDDNICWLRASYWSCPAVFSWPAAHDAAVHGQLHTKPEYRQAVKTNLEGVMRMISSTSQYMSGKFHPVVWSQAQAYLVLVSPRNAECRLFAAALMGVVALSSPYTADLAPPALFQYMNQALSVLKLYAPFCPSIEKSCHNLMHKMNGLGEQVQAA